MNDLIEKLINMIDEQFHYEKDSGNAITLIETQSESTCKPIVLKKKSGKTFTLKLDLNKKIKVHGNSYTEIDIHPLLRDGKMQCDYVVFCQKNQKLFVFLIALKSKNSTGWIKQSKAGESVVRYLLGMLENHSGKIILPNTEFRHILFNTKTKEKKNSASKAFQYDREEKFNILFTRKPCNREYDLEIFLR